MEMESKTETAKIAMRKYQKDFLSGWQQHE